MTKSPKPWYEAAFGADYLERYAHRDQQEADRTVRTFFSRAMPDPEGTAMDLCCGAGRHVLAMHAQGFRVIGLDLSADLLEAGLQALKNKTPGIHCPLFVRGDKRKLPFADASFSIVTHFFTAFGYFQNDEENFGVFREVARVLEPGGLYLFDFLSSPAVYRAFETCDAIETTENFDDETRVDSLKRLTDERRRVEKRMRFYHGSQLQREIVETVRLFSPAELRGALAEANLSIQNEWGDYQASPYDESSSWRWIALSRRNCFT